MAVRVWAKQNSCGLQMSVRIALFAHLKRLLFFQRVVWSDVGGPLEWQAVPLAQDADQLTSQDFAPRRSVQGFGMADHFCDVEFKLEIPFTIWVQPFRHMGKAGRGTVVKTGNPIKETKIPRIWFLVDSFDTRMFEQQFEHVQSGG